MPAPSSPSPSSAPPASSRTNTALFVIFLVFGAVFLGVGVQMAREQRHILAHSFPVPATVVGLDVERHSPNGRSTTYRPVVRFEYQIDGTTRMGDQVDALRESRGGHWAWRVLDRYEVGQHVTAWVRDDVPDAAYLDRTPSRTPYIMLSFGALFDVSTLLVWWRARRAGRRAASSQQASHD